MSSGTEYHSITAECVDVRGPRFVAWVTTATGTGHRTRTGSPVEVRPTGGPGIRARRGGDCGTPRPTRLKPKVDDLS